MPRCRAGDRRRIWLGQDGRGTGWGVIEDSLDSVEDSLDSVTEAMTACAVEHVIGNPAGNLSGNRVEAVGEATAWA